MHWEDVPAIVDDWAERAAAPAYDLRRAAADVFTSAAVGYYYDPVGGVAALHGPGATDSDRARVKAAAARGLGPAQVRGPFLSGQDLADPDARWVKVAYSPSLRRLGELLNFFPGQYPGGLPNAPSPLAAMLTSGLLGSGLGWGAGHLAARALPPGYGDRLPRTGALLGAGVGALPGAVWGLANASSGHRFNDPSVLNHAADAEPGLIDSAADGTNAVFRPPQTGVPPAVADYVQHLHAPHFKRGADALAALAAVPVGSLFAGALAAFKEAGDTFGYRGPEAGADVNINHLGQTLWDTGASPQLAATTMGALYAAQQLPDPDARPGWATGRQLGQLAVNAAGDYAMGVLVGQAINQVVGTPYGPSAFGLGNLALGVLGAVVPKLFGG
jgi:hypothetical protein